MRLGGQGGDTIRPEVIVPPALYLPLVDNPEGFGQIAIVLDLSDGRRGLLAYTALDRLADQCGRNQPWMLLMTSEIHRVREAQPFDVVAFDLEIPARHRRGGRLS